MSMPIPLSTQRGRETWRKTLQEEIKAEKSCTCFFERHGRELALLALDELDVMQAKIDALIELYNASREITEARSEEHAAAVAEDDYMTGGKIHTAGRLEDARARVLSACDKGASAIAKCRNLGVEI